MPTTANQDDYVIIDWTAPFNNGIVISGYSVTIRSKAETYLSTVACDGNDPQIVSATLCKVPLATLTASPYLLALGETVNVKIAATNTYGTSDFSAMGAGAVI